MAHVDSAIVVALITVVGAVPTASFSYLLAKRHKREAEWRNAKLAHYRELLAGISDLAMDNDDREAHRRFASAINTVALVAPQDVVEAVLAFHQGVKASNPDRSIERHDRLLAALLLALRRDLGIKPQDDPSTFRYHLAGIPPGGTVRRRP